MQMCRSHFVPCARWIVSMNGFIAVVLTTLPSYRAIQYLGLGGLHSRRFRRRCRLRVGLLIVIFWVALRGFPRMNWQL